MGDGLNAVKKAANSIKNGIVKVAKACKFFMSTLGMIVGLIITAAVLALIITVFVKTLENSLGTWQNADYAGVSNAGDYEYIVSSLGYAGYDSMITEKNWQEFMAYEYAVLMDVAEYIWEGQNKAGESDGYKDKVMGPYPEDYYADNNGMGGKTEYGDKGPDYMPYLPVIQEYNSAALTKEDWNKLVIAGQGSARFGIQNEGELGNAEFAKDLTILGGNRDVMPPTLMYEYRTNPYDPDAGGSLVPYIAVLKEELGYYYFTVGSEEEFAGTVDSKSGGVVINKGNIDKVDLMEISQLLNIENPYLPKATVWSNYWEDNPEKNPTLPEGKDARPIADKPFEQNLYFTNTYGSVMYRTALEIMINRYLPKASLLTSWYYVKDTDSQENISSNTNFNVDELIKDVKAIYNYYCWEKPGESYTSETTNDAVQFNEIDGSVIRDKDGNAKKGTLTQQVATTNNDTFIHFGQAGIESNRFDVFKEYKPNESGKGRNAGVPDTIAPKAPVEITGDEDEKTIPVITDLLSENAQFMDRFGIKVDFRFDYRYRYWVPDEDEDGGGHWVYAVDLDHDVRTNYGTIIIPYEATHMYEPNGDKSYQPRGHYKPQSETPSYIMEELSKIVHNMIVLKAEELSMDEIAGLREASDFEIEYQEKEFINHGYWYPEETDKKGKDVQAKILEFFDERYRHLLGFYDFTAFSGDANYSEDTFKQLFENKINEVLAKTWSSRAFEASNDPFLDLPVSDVYNGMSEGVTDYNYFLQLIVKYISEYYSIGGGSGQMPTNFHLNPQHTIPHNGEYVAFNNVTIDMISMVGPIADEVRDAGIDNPGFLSNGDFVDDGTGKPIKYFDPVFTPVSVQDSPYDAIYDIDDYDLSLSMNVPQKRISTMIVTDVEAWAKSANYTIEIINNTFDYTNYRYVVPHSYFNFGTRKFYIDENPSYRTSYYKKYFSKQGNEEAAIKEADVLNILLKWEEFARSGNDTAYAYMRDLYKLIMYIREKEDHIMNTAYSYIYVPDTVWEFREGVSQEKFWTERLAAEMPGKPDELTEEELKQVQVVKDEIAWQVLDYDEYEECDIGSKDTAKVYALFPFGSPYIRSYFQTQALNSGRFDDGGFIEGHKSADWTARDKIGEIMSGAGFGIYDYELKLRTAKKILNSSAALGDKTSRALAALKGSTSDSLYIKAKEELDAELKEQKIKSPIVAITAALVTRANYECYAGFSVALNHGNEKDTKSVNSSYVHMRRWPNVQTGDIVGPGTLLGHEGTTGNSSGYHLHMNFNFGQEEISNALYMGPIFTPFYNKEKILETMTKITSNENGGWGGDPSLILGTEYMDLIRTVLMYPIGTDPNSYLFSEAALTTGSVTTMLNCSIMEVDGKEYINYVTGSKNGVPMVYQGKNQVIVKVGGDNATYYLCNVTSEMFSQSIVSGEVVETTNYLRIASKRKIEFNENTLAGSIAVKADTGGSDELGRLIWGNNVPVRPVYDDMHQLVDITVLNTERPFDPKKERYSREYANAANDPSGGRDKDVAARQVFFTPDEERLKVPDWILSYLSDMDSAYAVPFYEGAISVTMSEQVKSGARPIGYAGTSSGDVLLLKRALKMRGLAEGSDALTMDGEFDSKLETVLRNATSKISDGMVNNYFSQGVLGENPGCGSASEDYGHQGACYWNAYVTYGSVTASQTVGKAAARMGATALGLNTAFVMSVAKHESSFVPTVDSFLFCSNGQDVNYTITDAPHNIAERIVTYKPGVKKGLRRAIGLMQISTGGGGALYSAATYLGITAEDTDGCVTTLLRTLRNANTNAVIGAGILSDMMNMLYRDYYGQLKAAVNSNPAFTQMAKDAHMDKYHLGMMACATLMYNMGPAYTNDVIAALSNIKYTKINENSPYKKDYVSGRHGSACDMGYWDEVLNDIVYVGATGDLYAPFGGK